MNLAAVGAARLPTVWDAPSKSDLRNHQAIIQPRLYGCLMVTQITLKTESPHGFKLLSDRLPAEADPPCGEVVSS